MIYRWTYDTNLILAIEDLKRTFEDDSPNGHAIERYELQFSPAFGDWMSEHATWLWIVEMTPGLPKLREKPGAGWMMGDNVTLVPSDVCQGLARFVGIIDGGRTIRYATIVGGSA
jgi:hypothetical protein